ncbi:MAG: hypothetical protein WCI00_06450 [bacterium]
MKTKEEMYQKDYALLGMSLYITIIVAAIILVCACLADSTSVVILSSMKVNPKEIHNNLNLIWITERISIFICSAALIFPISFLLLRYLNHGFFDDIFDIPYKKDICGKLIPKTKSATEDFMHGLKGHFS